jgi:hypothetical protein
MWTDVVKLLKTYMDYFIQNPNVYRFFYFHHLKKSDKTAVNITESDEFKRKFAQTFKFMINYEKYTSDEISVIIKTIIYSTHIECCSLIVRKDK